MTKRDSKTTWRAKLKISTPENFLMHEEIRWPLSLNPVPTLVMFENTDKGMMTLELFNETKPSKNDIHVILKTLSEYLDVHIPDLKFEELTPEDWVSISLQDLGPVEAGRFYVHGSHLADQIPNNKTPLIIDTGFAFGTGHHDSTRGCLLALDKLADMIKPKTCLDLGCGTSILALATKTLWPSAIIIASDIELDAVQAARKNAKKNKLVGIDVCLAEGFDHPRLRHTQFDLITANILANPLMDLSAPMAARTNKNATLILSGILKMHQQKVLSAYEKQGFKHIHTIQDETWPTLILRKV